MDTNKPYYGYVIKSECGRYYIGISENAEERTKQHNEGKSKWTSRYKNWEMIYKKKFDNLKEARVWENQLKRQKGGNGFKAILENKNDGPQSR